MTPTLHRALEGLRTEWERVDAGIVDQLPPGLTRNELDAIEVEFGHALPAEVRELWSWADGTNGEASVGPGSYVFLSSRGALKEYRVNREIHPEGTYEDIPEMYWHETWMPVFVQGPQRLYVDVARDTVSGRSPVRLVSWEWEDFDVDQAPSIEHTVWQWTWLLQAGYYSWDGETGSWDVRFTDIPIGLRKWG